MEGEKEPHRERTQTEPEILYIYCRGKGIESKDKQSEREKEPQRGGGRCETESSLASNRWLVLLVQAAPLSAVSTQTAQENMLWPYNTEPIAGSPSANLYIGIMSYLI